jgi:hypothetical protein
MFNDKCAAGVASVWSWNQYKPVMPLAVRAGDVEFLKGYDKGMVYRKAFIAGFKVGKRGERLKGGEDVMRAGWRCGYRKFVIAKLMPLVRGVKLDTVVMEVNYPDEDHVTGEQYRGGVKYYPLTKRMLIDTCLNRAFDCGEFPADLNEMKKWFDNDGEHDYGYLKLMTRKEARKAKADAEYKRIERAAQNFQCGHKMGSMAFLKALDKAVNKVAYKRERWNDSETRMEEWGNCMYSGAGSDTYFDDLNYVNSRFEGEQASLEDVYKYIEKKFPILFMQYQEWKARKK